MTRLLGLIMFTQLAIRKKVRALLGLLVLLLAVVTILRVSGYHETRHVFEVYETSSADLLKAIDRAEAAAQRTPTLLTDISMAENRNELELLHEEGQRIARNAREAIAGAGIKEPTLGVLSKSLNEMEYHLGAVAEAKMTEIHAREDYGGSAQRVVDNAGQVKAMVSGAVSDALAAARSDLENRSSDVSLFDDMLLLVEPTVSLRTDVAAMLATLESQINRGSKTFVEFDQDFDTVVGSFARLDIENRTAFASALTELRSAVAALEAHGVVLQQAESILSSALAEGAHAASQGLLEMTDLKRAVDQQALSLFETQRDKALRSGAIELILLLVVGLGVVVSVWLMISRQVSDRIELLAEDVLTLAHGDLSTPARVSGEDEIGRMAAALEVFRDTARRLNRSNADLESLTNASSHDLRSTLLGIRDLAAWTVEDHGDQLPDDAKANLQSILLRCQRMSKLLSDLLEFARMRSHEAPAEAVDIPNTLDDIKVYIAPPPEFDIRVLGQTTIHTQSEAFSTILMNLVKNAVRHHDRSHGVIIVRTTVEAGFAEIEIKDDGPGIPEQHQMRIFELFQTLEADEGRGGSGVGLAMSRKLAEQLGGTLTVKSNPSERRGAVFILRIPVSVEDAETKGGRDKKRIAA